MKSLEPLLDKAAQDRDVLAVMLFGSRARGEKRPDSDIDICLVLMPALTDKRQSFGKRLEYAGEFDVDVHIYQQVPLYIRQRIHRDGKVLFCRNEEMLCELACKTVTEFADYEDVYRDYLKEVAGG